MLKIILNPCSVFLGSFRILMVCLFLLKFTHTEVHGGRILILGDSHTVGHFGEHLHRQIHQLGGWDILSMGIGGAGSYHFVRQLKNNCCGYIIRNSVASDTLGKKQLIPRMEQVNYATGEVIGKVWDGDLYKLVKSYVPDVALIVLGSNYMNDHLGLIEKLKSARIDIQFVWVGPFRRQRLDVRLRAIEKVRLVNPDIHFIPMHDIAGHDSIVSIHFSSYTSERIVNKVVDRLKPILDSLNFSR
jgi:hypothetical protein